MLDANAAVPLYAQLEQKIESQIANRALHPGDRLLDRETHRMLGTVTAVEPLPASTLPLTEAVGDIPGQADVYLTVTAKADRAGHPVVAGRELYPGAALSLSSWDFSGTGTVERVDFS